MKKLELLFDNSKIIVFAATTLRCHFGMEHQKNILSVPLFVWSCYDLQNEVSRDMGVHLLFTTFPQQIPWWGAIPLTLRHKVLHIILTTCGKAP